MYNAISPRLLVWSGLEGAEAVFLLRSVLGNCLGRDVSSPAKK